MSIDNRNYNDLEASIAHASYILYKDYLSELNTFEVPDILDVHHENAHKTIEDTVKLLKLTKVCYEKGEDILQKLSTVYNAALLENVNLLILLDAQLGKPIDFYFGFSSFTSHLGKNIGLMKSGFNGNFTGTELTEFKDTKDLMADILDNSHYLASVSSTSSIRGKNETEDKNFIQGIERFIDSMQGETYSAFFIANPVDSVEQIAIKNNLENLYTQLSTFRKDVIALSEGTSNTLSKNITHSTANTEGTTKTHTGSLNLQLTGGLGSIINGGLGLMLGPLGGSLGASKSSNLGGGIGAGYSYSHSKTVSETETEATSTGHADGTSNGSSLQYEQENKVIENLLKQIELQLEKIEKGISYGLYRFAAYFLSNRSDSVTLASHTYKALMLGEGSEIERRSVNFWSSEEEEQEKNLEKMKKYLASGQHPTFEKEGEYYTATTFVNGMELPIHMGIPTKSVVGLPVVEHARFGRSVPVIEKETIDLGCIFHMGSRDTDEKVALDVNNLTSHTFITGSTGSGKSNTIYTLLDKLTQENKKFLVIEPTKGEYKNVFGGRDDLNVAVYGTNHKLTPLLRINPFKFHEDIHVLEHLDRLVDIFNVCWAMYAAMPAILKEAMERAYESAGWDLKTSENSIDKNLFPTFADVLDQISIVLNESEYSSDNKGDYIGALSTRLRSLTTGLNGMIFTQNDLSDQELFEQNVVVDLSRVGSMDTKALIMGLLVMKLSEYYMVSDLANAELRHVTVLEEAHNLLKRTSTEQSTEGANLLGKSVEMLSNAIAEMRTYGEGFIIADQSPNMLDMSAIRNTNTKIIMKLPDEADRELVGKSANLNDDQIIELARLKTGVAAVYQNNWLESVLCQVEEYTKNSVKFQKIQEQTEIPDIRAKILEAVLNEHFAVKENPQLVKEVLASSLKASIKRSFLENDRKKVVFALFHSEKAIEKLDSTKTPEDWLSCLKRFTSPKLEDYPNQEQIITLILEEQVWRNENYQEVLTGIKHIFNKVR